MLNGTIGGKSNSLLSEYSSLLGEAVLRDRARVAEQSAQIETDLANKVKSEFLSNMSHELRTPLNTIVGFSKILQEHGERPLQTGDIVDYAQLINNAANHLLSVINDILDISKLQSGRYTMQAGEFDLHSVLSSCTAPLRATAQAAGVTLQTNFATDHPMVRGDGSKLTQAFQNLIGNAVKFTPEGGSVSVESMGTNDGGSMILISDTGVGMSREELAIALEPFGQVDGTRSRWREGTGLGLSIAKAFIELHGGRMDIVSAKGEGCEVAIYLPSPNHVSVVQNYNI